MHHVDRMQNLLKLSLMMRGIATGLYISNVFLFGQYAQFCSMHVALR